MKNAISKVVEKIDLSEQEMVGVMDQIMSGEASEAQIGSFITALRMKGESIDEIVGAVKVMREKATFVDTGVDTSSDVLLDIVGTGGDGSHSFNVSTTSAFVIAAAGVPVAKHGNRAVSSTCGSADVLEALGVDLGLNADKIGQCVREIGIGFLFAPMLHGAMKYAIGPRRAIGIRTLFNVLGPLTNPAGANVQVTGVFAKELTTVIAQVLLRLGMKRTLVVWGDGNLDELSISGPSYISDAHDGQVTDMVITPEEVGLKRADFMEIRGGKTPEEAATQVREVLQGTPGAKLDTVLLNAGAALVAADKAIDISEGVKTAREVISSGAAMDKLEQLIAFCKK